MIKIVKATKEDAYDYANILNKSWKDTYGEYVSIEHIDDEFNIDILVSNFESYIDNEDYNLYMIKDDDINVGILEVGSYEDKYKENMDGIGEIRTIHIKKEYQNKGIGKIAINFAIDELKSKGYKTVCLWVKKQNYRAISFYEKFGFIKTIYDLEETVDGAPSMIMEKEIED